MTTWTREKPKVPGVYWMASPRCTPFVHPVEFGPTMLDQIDGTHVSEYSDLLSWYGPIQPPPLPEETP